MQPKVSVIIPVYKAENYIEMCIGSVTGQTLKEIEIIVVNDCTPDGSMEIVKRLQQEDSRIITIENPDNLGAGPSRNAGLKQATGECIQFLDADDWLESMALETAYRTLKQTEAQFVAYGMKRSASSAKNDQAKSEGEKTKGDLKQVSETDRHHEQPVCITDKRQWIDMISQREISIYVWDKLYNAGFLKKNDLYFDSMYTTEDYAFNFKMYPHIKKIAMIPDVFYNFRLNPISATQGHLAERNVRGHVQLVCRALQFVSDQNLEDSEAGRRITDDIFGVMKQMFTRYFKNHRIDEKIEALILECVKEYFGNSKEYKLIFMLLLKICKECESAVAFMKADGEGKGEYEVFDKTSQVLSDMIVKGEVDNKDNIIIYGTGNWGKCFYKALFHRGIRVIAFTNSEQRKEGDTLYGIPIIPTNKIRDTKYTKILIASTYIDDISRTLDEAGYALHKDYEYGPLW